MYLFNKAAHAVAIFVVLAGLVACGGPQSPMHAEYVAELEAMRPTADSLRTAWEVFYRKHERLLDEKTPEVADDRADDWSRLQSKNMELIQGHETMIQGQLRFINQSFDLERQYRQGAVKEQTLEETLVNIKAEHAELEAYSHLMAKEQAMILASYEAFLAEGETL